MIIQCDKCGWLQFAASDGIADMMEEDHLLDDGCLGGIMRSEGAKA